MSKVKSFISKSYVFLIIGLFYIPLFFAAVFSFSAGAKKGDMKLNFSYSGEGWSQIVHNENITTGIVNSLLLAIPAALLVALISLFTVYALWKQKSKTIKGAVAGAYNIPLINPDIITAISLSILFGAMFGVIQIGSTGYLRALVSHVTMILPFGITVMYPKSEKFSKSMLEASYDLGYRKFNTWMNTYVRHMLFTIVAVVLIAITLSFDDFIITRVTTTNKYVTLGTRMYESSLKPWILAVGSFMMFMTLAGSIGASLFVKMKKGRSK